MKDFLNKIIANKTKEAESIRSKIKASESADEVRSLGETLQAVLDELNEAKAKLDELDKEDDKGDESNDSGDEGATANEGEGESASRSAFNPMKAIGGANMKGNQIETRGNVLSTMEERTAFMNFYMRGEKSEHLRYETRSGDEAGTSANLGVLIPQTIIQEIIKDLEKVRGTLYNKVRKTNVKGGVKYPIGSFSATFHRITETTKSDRQNAGGVGSDSIVFTYKIGEIRLARTLLQTVLSVPVFEQEFAKVVVEAYLEAMDKEIMVGDPSDDEMNGILTEAAKVSGSRVTNVIEFTEEDMADWTKWQTKLFAKIPLSMRGARPEFVMTAGTYEANIKTLKDDNNRPVYAETFNPVDGTETSTFKGKEVAFVEDDILANFDDIDVSAQSTDSPYFGMYWVPAKAYAINSNMQFAVRDYYDEETNQFVKKATVINDGNVLDGNYIFLLKKVASVQG